MFCCIVTPSVIEFLSNLVCACVCVGIEKTRAAHFRLLCGSFLSFAHNTGTSEIEPLIYRLFGCKFDSVRIPYRLVTTISLSVCFFRFFRLFYLVLVCLCVCVGGVLFSFSENHFPVIKNPRFDYKFQ